MSAWAVNFSKVLIDIPLGLSSSVELANFSIVFSPAALNFFHPDETYEILGVPKDENWQMAAMITMGYPKGTWGVASRRPAHEVSYRNQWGSDTGFEINEPMWPGSN